MDLYVQGHEHEYFRLDPSEIPDYYPTTVSHDNEINKQLVPGAESFVVGTGGVTLDYLDQPGQMFDTHFPGLESYVVAPNAASKLDLRYCGALRLSLTSGHSSYEFVGLDGGVLDGGTTSCTPVTAKPTRPYERAGRARNELPRQGSG